MLLNEVISILKGPVEGMGYTNTSFYILLFSCLDESANEDEPGIDDIVKQVFSKRGLKRNLMSKLMTPGADMLLSIITSGTISLPFMRSEF